MSIADNHLLRQSQGGLRDPLLNANEAAPLLGVSIPTFWRWVTTGKLPKPVKLGRLSRWPQSEILAVIETAKSARHPA